MVCAGTAAVQKRFETKTQVLGHGEGCSSAVQVLNRTIRLEEGGLTIEADESAARL